MEEIEKNNGEIILYQTEDGRAKIEVRLENEDIWLTQQQMAELFQTSRTNIVEHIKHIFDEGELEEKSTCRNFRQVRMEGNRKVERSIPFYNLDMIISLGYRVKSNGEQVLQNAGTVSHEQAKQRALNEYRKYQAKTLSPVEQAYFDSIKKLANKTSQKKKK